MRSCKIHPKSDNTDIANFIRNTFHRRECMRFVDADVHKCLFKTKNNDTTESSKPGSTNGNAINLPIAESICKCGYSKTMHSNESVRPAMSCNMSNSWSVEEDTETRDRPTNAYGEMESGDSKDYKLFNKSTFIRLDYEDDLDKVKELFHKYWKMKDPELFMSIISSDKRRDQNPQEEDTRIEKFCEKLVEAAAQTNAWIITEGATEGIGGIVGDKIKKVFDEKEKRPMVVLSICNWGCIKDKHRHIKKDEQENCLATVFSRCVHLFAEPCGCIRNKHCLMKKDEQKNYLATHSVCNERGGRCEANEVSLDQNHTTYVLVDDGRQFHPGCERIFREKLELKLREYPSKERDEYSSTGDSIPLIYFLVGGDKSDFESVERALANQIPVIVAAGTGGEADRMAKIVKSKEAEGEIEKDRKYHHIKKIKENLFVLFDTSSIEDGILELLKGGHHVSKHSPTHMFVLAADWDKKTFFEELLWEKPEGSDLEDVLCKLLMNDKCSYVEILLGNGVKVKLAEVVKRTKELELNGVLENKIVACLLEQIIKPERNLSQTEIESKTELCAAKFLCLWSVYRGNTEMAKLFLRQGKDYLAMASMAYTVSRKQKKKLAGKEECDARKEQMNEFKTLATGFLSTCDKDSRQKTIALLRGPVPDLKEQTPMQIALDSDFKEFVAQPSFQELLDQIWTKQLIDYNKKKYIPLTVAIICPLAASILFKYREDEKPREYLDDLNPTTKWFLNFFPRVASFLDAPVIKFTYNTLSYLGYLVLFSIVMLTDFRNNMSPAEIGLTIWTFILIIEECRQAYCFLGEYLNKWNLIDVVALTLYVFGFILRLIYQSIPSICLECLYVARIVLCISLLLSVLRVLQLLSIHPTLGPKIYMIGRLLKDMISFLLIMTIFISAYGIVSNVILYPNQPLNAKLLQDVFYDAWWSAIGQFNSDDAIGTNCMDIDPKSPNVSVEYCSSRTDPNVDYVACKESRCPANTWLVSVLLALYALFTVIMMLNVLIAMFNVTFTKVETKQKRVSKMQRYRLIREYHFRSMLPAPLSVFAYLKYVPWLCRRCKCCCCTGDGDQENLFSKPMGPFMKTWEERMFKKYEDDIIIQKQREIAVVRPESGDDDRWGVYKLVLNDRISSLSQMEQRLMQHISKTNRRDDEEEDEDKNGALIETHSEFSDPQSLKTSSSSSIPSTPPTPGIGSPPTSPTTTTTTTTTSDKKSCMYEDYCYKMKIQDDQSRRGRGKKQKSIVVKAYPGRHHLKKATCSRSDCKMVINCKDGRVFKLQKPFRDYGVPPKSSEFPAYRLPLENIGKIDCKCRNLSEGSVCAESTTSNKKEVKTIRMPYGGVVIPPKDGDDKYILFDHEHHRGRSAPVRLNRSPSQAVSVRQKDINKSMRPGGKTSIFLPSSNTNPEVSRGVLLQRTPQVEGIQ